jgi:hypothetical protein
MSGKPPEGLTPDPVPEPDNFSLLKKSLQYLESLASEHLFKDAHHILGRRISSAVVRVNP